MIVEVVLIRKVGRFSKIFDYLSLLCSSYAAASLEQVSTTFDPRFRSASNTDLQQIYLSRQWIQSVNSKLIHHFATCVQTIDHSVLSEVHDNIVVLQILVCHSMLVCTTHNSQQQGSILVDFFKIYSTSTIICFPSLFVNGEFIRQLYVVPLCNYWHYSNYSEHCFSTVLREHSDPSPRCNHVITTLLV